VTASQTTKPLGHFSDYLRHLADQPPADVGEHLTAAATLLRHAAKEAVNLFNPDAQKRVAALTQLAATHTRLAEAIVAADVQSADL
jgi:hypothetical protein